MQTSVSLLIRGRSLEVVSEGMYAFDENVIINVARRRAETKLISSETFDGTVVEWPRG